MKASEYLTTAAQIVAGASNTTHGDKERSFTGIAAMWNAYLANRPRKTATLDGEDVAHMMVLMKMMRGQHGTPVDDHFIDMAGYAAIAGEIAMGDGWPEPVPPEGTTITATGTVPLAEKGVLSSEKSLETRIANAVLTRIAHENARGRTPLAIDRLIPPTLVRTPLNPEGEEDPNRA